MNVIVSPDTIAPPAAKYAHAVLSTAPARLLHTAGVVPVAPDKSVPTNIGKQAEIVWANVVAILEAAEMTVHDIVSMTTYVVAGQDLSRVMAARDAVLDGHIAASTLVTVPALAQPAWKVEAAIVAAA